MGRCTYDGTSGSTLLTRIRADGTTINDPGEITASITSVLRNNGILSPCDIEIVIDRYVSADSTPSGYIYARQRRSVMFTLTPRQRPRPVTGIVAITARRIERDRAALVPIHRA